MLRPLFSCHRLMLVAPALSLLAVFRVAGSAVAQPAAAPAPGDQAPAGDPTTARKPRRQTLEERAKQVEDQDRALQATREALAKLDFEAALSTKVSVAVRDASAQEIVKVVQKAGFPLPVEVRQAPLVPITLTVKDVTARSVFTAIALFSRSELYLFKDYLLIAPPTALSLQETQITQTLSQAPAQPGALPTQRVTAFTPRQQALEHTVVLAQAVVDEMKQRDREQMALGELSPLLQQVVQRLNGTDTSLATSRGRARLSPDTAIIYKREMAWNGTVPMFVLQIFNHSQNRKLEFRFPDVPN